MTAATDFVRWQPSLLMEWAKSGYVGGKYNLARSGIPSISDLADIPGGPFEPDIWGHNEWGHEGLKARIAELYGVASDNVLIAQGASQCNFLIAGAALAGGGEAIVETPIYEPILRSVEVWADRIRRLPRRQENGYQPDPDEFKTLLSGNVRIVALTNLHNPTHVSLEQDRLTSMVESAKVAGAIIMIDEVFLPMVRRDFRIHGFSLGAVSLSSFGKSWGLDALRIGWAVGPKDLIHRAYRLNNLLGVNQPYMTEDLAWRIMSSAAAMTWMTARADEAAKGRELFDEFLRETPEVSCVQPCGGISALVDLPSGTEDRQFAGGLLDKYDTVVFPGSYFEKPGSLRVSFGGPHDEVEEGLKRLSQFVRGKRP